MVAAGTMEEKMRVLSQSELLRLSRLELTTLLRKIASGLPALPEGSHELRIAHYNRYNIRLTLARPDSGRAKLSGSVLHLGSEAFQVRSCLGRFSGCRENRLRIAF